MRPAGVHARGLAVGLDGGGWLLAALSALVAVVLATAVIYPLARVAPVSSLSVVYLPAVLLLSARWGLLPGLATSLLSAAAFNFFHLPPVGRFTIYNSGNWVALITFTVVALAAAALAGAARRRALEAEQRRAEADLAAQFARELLAGTATAERLGVAARRLASALELRSARIELHPVRSDERRLAIALQHAGAAQIGTLLVPRELSAEQLGRVTGRVAPTLAAILQVALHRERLQAEAIETEALRRSDSVKTALLRAVSHDLRTPLTTIVAAGHALASPSLTDADRGELAGAVVQESERLARLVEQLLDLSRLEAVGTTPRREWVSLEEVISAACDGAGRSERLRVVLEPGLPEVRADAAQLERAVANLLENALRYCPDAPVSLHGRRSGELVQLSIVDQGPGIEAAEQERIFEPFYRGRGTRRQAGSGLGLAIARGLVAANGGELTVSSLPGQGASFTISLPREGQAAGPVRPRALVESQ
jgi:two-component system sensor histidine kinase KdpD